MKNSKAKVRFKSMIFLLLPIIAGLAIAFQGALSSSITNKLGAIETVILIHFFGLLVAVIIYFIQGNTTFSFIKQVDLIPVIAGALGVVIIFSISKSFIENGALTTIMISVLVQLLVSKMIDHFGLFGVNQSPLTFSEGFGMILMICGVVLYQGNK